jgi:aspartokinase-like uncharacterized kinase
MSKAGSFDTIQEKHLSIHNLGAKISIVITGWIFAKYPRNTVFIDAYRRIFITSNALPST